MTWADDDIELLRKMASAGKSAAQMSRALSSPSRTVTRNAVIGKCRRINVRLQEHSKAMLIRRKSDRPWNPPRPWCAEDMTLLRKSIESGCNMAQLVTLLGRVPSVIGKKLKQYGMQIKPKKKVQLTVVPEPSSDPQEPRGCRFVYGDVQDGNWRYCQRERLLPTFWCAEHERVVFNVERIARARRAA